VNKSEAYYATTLTLFVSTEVDFCNTIKLD